LRSDASSDGHRRGVIGSQVVDRLLADGYRVIVVDDLSTGSRERVADEAELEGEK